MLSEELELPCIQDDFPNYHLKQNADIPEKKNKDLTDEQFRNQVAFQYLQNLEKVIKMEYKSVEQRNTATVTALDLYDNQFNKILANHIFHVNEFPTAETIEEKFDVDFDIITKLFYSETCFRHSFTKMFSQQFNFQIARSSWNNYTLLFETLTKNSKIYDLPIPKTWIWDILDEYSYQFYMCSRWRKGQKNEDQLQKFGGDFDFWNFAEVVARLNAIIDTSQVLDRKFNIDVDNLKSLHYFGFYSLLALVKVNVMVGQFDKALEALSSINFKYLIVFSRSGGAYQALFTYAGFSYLMKNKFKEAATLFQLITVFYNKYRPLYSKSYQFEQMNKNFEKVVSLLAISLVFYPEPLDDTIKQIFKDTKIKSKRDGQPEQVYEKFEKLNKYDIQTFSELFLFAAPKIILAIADQQDAETYKNEANVNDLLNEQKDKLAEEFLRIQKLNNISQTLKLYTKLSLEKSARLLQISQEELQRLLDLHKQRSSGPLENTPFEQTIIKNYLSDTSLLDIKIQGDQIIVNQSKNSNNDVTQQLSKLNAKLEKMMLDLV